MRLASVMAGATGLRMAALGVSLITNILVARELGPSGRGEYTLLLTFVGVVSAAVGLSGEQGVTEQSAQGEVIRRRSVSAAFWGAFVVGALGALLAAGALWRGVFGLPSGLWWAAAVLTVLTCSQLWCQRLLVLQGQVMTSAVLAVVEATVFLLGVAVASRMDRLDVDMALAWYAIGLTAGVMITGIRLRPRVSRRWLAEMGGILRKGIRYHPGQLALNLMMRVDVLVLGALGSTTQVGVYSVGLALTAPLGVLGTAIASTLVAGQVAASETERRKVTVALLRITAAVTAVSAVLVAVAAPIMIPFLWGKDFSGAVPVTWVLLTGAFLLAVQRPIGTYLVAEGMSRAMNRRALAGLLVACIATAALVPQWQAMGAAVGASLGYLAYVVESIRQFAVRTGRTSVEVVRAIVRLEGPGEQEFRA